MLLQLTLHRRALLRRPRRHSAAEGAFGPIPNRINMDLQKLNKICFTVCIVCIVLGIVLALAMIWGEIKNNPLAWKCWLTIAVFFLGSALTMSVTRALGGGSDKKDTD